MSYFVPSEDTLKTKIRAMCGSPDTTRLTAAQLDYELDEALRTINRLAPRVRLSTQTTTADTQDYKIAYDGGGLTNFQAGKEVLYSLDALGFFADEFVSIASLGPFSPVERGLSTYDNPSLPDIAFIKAKEFRRRFGGTGEFVEKTDGTYIRLVPAPSKGDDTVPFFWFQNRLLTDLEARYEQQLLNLAVGRCLILMGEAQEDNPEGSLGGSRDKFKGSHRIKRGETMIKEAERQLRRPSYASR